MVDLKMLRIFIKKGWWSDVQRLVPEIIAFDAEKKVVVYDRESFMENHGETAWEIEDLLHDEEIISLCAELVGNRFDVRFAIRDLYDEYPAKFNDEKMVEMFAAADIGCKKAEPELLFPTHYEPDDETINFLKLKGVWNDEAENEIQEIIKHAGQQQP